MELFYVLLAALGTAVVLTLVFSGRYRRGGGWIGVWAFFLIILLFAAAGGIWTTPYGPAWGGVPWFGILLWGLLIALVLVAFSKPAGTPPPRRGTLPTDEETSSAFAYGAAFWLLVVILLIALVAGVVR